MRKKLSARVRPGVPDVRARPRTLNKELIRLDLPTFDRPRKAISGLFSRGQSASLKPLFTNSALLILIYLTAEIERGNRCLTLGGGCFRLLGAFSHHALNQLNAFANAGQRFLIVRDAPN